MKNTKKQFLTIAAILLFAFIFLAVRYWPQNSNLPSNASETEVIDSSQGIGGVSKSNSHKNTSSQSSSKSQKKSHPKTEKQLKVAAS